MSVRLLVTYGTLLRRFERHGVLGVEEDLEFVTRTRLNGELYNLGAYPGAIPGDGIVCGELFRIHRPGAIRRIDRYEGYNSDREEASLFVRRRVSLNVPTDETAWVYWYNGDVSEYERIPSGDWTDVSDGIGDA